MRFLLMLMLLLLAGPVRADDAAGSFPQFCSEWIEKLAARERDNIAHIKWESDGSAVHGNYIGYTQEHTCITKMGSQSTPVGKITYREIKWEKAGGSVQEAAQNTARAVETTEITEIFRYAGGKWIY